MFMFVFRVSKAITNKQTKEKIFTASIWFNKFLWHLRDNDIRNVFKYFQRIFVWIAASSIVIILIVSISNLKLPKGIFLFVFYSFSFSLILAFSIWWILNHKTEIKNMFKKDKIFFNALILFSPLLMFFHDQYYHTGFYDIMKQDTQFPFSQDIPNIQLAILLTISMFFIFLIFPYLISIPIYLCLYLPIKAYVLYLKIVTKRFSKDLFLWSIILIYVIYGVWRIVRKYRI